MKLAAFLTTPSGRIIRKNGSFCPQTHYQNCLFIYCTLLEPTNIIVPSAFFQVKLHTVIVLKEKRSQKIRSFGRFFINTPTPTGDLSLFSVLAQFSYTNEKQSSTLISTVNFYLLPTKKYSYQLSYCFEKRFTKKSDMCLNKLSSRFDKIVTFCEFLLKVWNTLVIYCQIMPLFRQKFWQFLSKIGNSF